MTMIRCPECGKDISSDAASCPSCGKPALRSVAEAGSGGGSLGPILIGGIIGGIVGFVMRPEVFLVGQLPLSIVLTAGTTLQGMDRMLASAAQKSFMFLLAGVAIGALLGAVIGRQLSPQQTAVAKPMPKSDGEGEEKGRWDVV